MKIAISVESNSGLESLIAHHFGRCPYFAMVDMTGEQISSLEIITNPFFETHQPGQVPEFIKSQAANVMISGGMGRRALEFFSQFEIEVKTGATGTIEEVIQSFLAGELQDGASCAQSEAHHHGAGHHHQHGDGRRH
jgi:predicted Fe-Mo cluster-binding NifX family protein